VPGANRRPEPDARGDLYSVGVVLYEMLCGTLPFVGKTLRTSWRRHRTAPVPRLPVHLARYQEIIDRLMAKDPKNDLPPPLTSSMPWTPCARN